jgi:uncharacterized protein (DUF924 family)
MPPSPAQIVGFWRDAGPRRWFARDAAFDEAIRGGFEPAHHAAARGEYEAWGASAEGSLALLLLFDQFPRNLWRGSPHAYATDPLARQTARTAIGAGQDRSCPANLRPFFYLPFEHSEDLSDQDYGVALCEALERESADHDTLKWARLHRDIIARFGRFPHRNRALGRITTAAEQIFLDEGGFSG